jgi:hypothetical protein
MLCFPLSQSYQKYEREESKVVKKWSTSKFLADDDDETDNYTVSSLSASSKGRKHFRRKTKDQEDGNDDGVRQCSRHPLLVSAAFTCCD